MKKIKSEKQINRPDLKFTRIETLKKTIKSLKKLDEQTKQKLVKKDSKKLENEIVPSVLHTKSSKLLIESNKYK